MKNVRGEPDPAPASRAPPSLPLEARLLHGAVRFRGRLDDVLRGRLSRYLGAGAVGSGATAAALSLGAAGESPWVVCFALAAVSFAALLAVSWACARRNADDEWSLDALRRDARCAIRLVSRDLKGLAAAPKALRLLALARLARLGGLWSVGAFGWISLLLLLWGSSLSLQSLGVVLLGAGVSVMGEVLDWARRAEGYSGTAEDQAVALAAQEFPAVIDLARPLEVDTTFFEPTRLHQVVEALASWRTPHWQGREISVMDLQRHLQSLLPKVRIERSCWLGGASDGVVADLVVSGSVCLLLEHAGSEAACERALERLAHASRLWPGKPVIGVAFGMAGGASEVAVLEGRIRELRERLPVLTARVPTGRSIPISGL